MATYNVPPGPNITLASVLANGNDAGTASITANNGAVTIWQGGSTLQIPNTAVQGLKNLGNNAFAGYPLHLGTDLPAAGAANYLAPTDPAAKLSGYPLVPGVDVTGLSKAVAKAVETELTTTTATTIVTFTPTAVGLFLLKVVVRVVTAATTLTLTASWYDAAGTAQTYTWENAASLPVGIRLELPVILAAGTGGAITVSATAGTANQVYVSAAIEELV
jgi:hypothetical protein